MGKSAEVLTAEQAGPSPSSPPTSLRPAPHFFDDLGTGSMLMAPFCARVLKQLAPDSFLMKDEEVPPGASRGGNPAKETNR